MPDFAASIAPRAKFDVIVSNKKAVFVIDRCNDHVGVPSVTNDAERVVLYLAWEHDAWHKRIFYRDTDGRWDELVHDYGGFLGFKPGCPYDTHVYDEIAACSDE